MQCTVSCSFHKRIGFSLLASLYLHKTEKKDLFNNYTRRFLVKSKSSTTFNICHSAQ